MKVLFRSILIFCLVQAGWGLTVYKGTEAYLGQFPYQAMLLLNDREFVCGGSIIHKRWILTAGHCKRQNTYDGQYTVAIGGIKASAIDAVKYPIEAFIVHSEFSGVIDYYYDIALIRLRYDIQFSKIISLIKLPKNNLNKYENDLAVLSGWGKVNPNKFAETLQYTQIRIVRQQVCSYHRQDQFNPVHDSQICCSVDEQKSACNGDSGGPLVVNDTQVGIVSYGVKYCLQSKPDVYTRVSFYLPWIKHQMISYNDVLPY